MICWRMFRLIRLFTIDRSKEQSMSQSANRTHIESPKTPLQVYVILGLGVASVSFSPILVRVAQGENVPSLLIAASRLILAAIALTPFALRNHWSTIRSLKRVDWFYALSSGAFLSLHFASWVTSLEYTSVLLSTVFVTSSPIWVALFEFFFLKARLPRLVVIGLVIAISGGIMIGFAGQVPNRAQIEGTNDLIGGGLSLLGALAMAVYLIIGRKLRANMHVIPYIWIVYGCAGLILSTLVLASGTTVMGYSSTGYLALIALTIFPQLIGHSSFNFAIGYLPATIVSMVTLLEPIGSSILALILFSELPLLFQIIGSGIILLGVLLANWGQNQKRK